MTHARTRSRTAGRRLIPLLLSLAVVAACGQKSGVAGSDESDASDEAPAPADTAAPEATQPLTTEAGESTTPAATTGSSEPATETSEAAATTEPAAVGPYEPGDNDTAGVTDTEIVIGIHAPVTGASPIPQTSFDVGKDIYWKFLAESRP